MYFFNSRYIIPTLCVLLAALLSLVPYASLSAQEGTQEQPLEVFDGQEGRYEVDVTVLPERPIIGSIHFMIELADAQTSQPVNDAEVVVVAIHQEETLAFQARALSTPNDRDTYRSNLTLNTAGPWTVEVRIQDASLGEATATFPLDVAGASASLGGAGAAVLLVIVLALVGGTAYVWHSSRKRLKELARQQGHPTPQHPR